MARLISLLIDGSRQRLLGALLWLGSFVVVVAVGLFLALVQLSSTLGTETQRPLESMVENRAKISATRAMIASTLTAAPCSFAFQEQMRALAYRPDGINEFLYAPDGKVYCSVGRNLAGYDLGMPDLTPADGNFVYLERNLDFLGMPGERATIVRTGDFAMVVPKFDDKVSSSSWFDQELVMNPGQMLIHRAGVPGIGERASGAVTVLGDLSWRDGSFYLRLCDVDGLQCAVTEAQLASILRVGWPILLLSVVTCALVALGISGQLHAMLRRFWSFEARFLRHFDAKSIICTYQPILSLDNDSIHGCEVLVRWRDVDGSVVFPDQFLPIIERRGLTRALTRYVIDKAWVELSERVPPGRRLQINFNISPRDLDAVWLRDTLSRFEAAPERFRPVVEITESDELEIERAQREVDALRRYGIRTHLDDFGTGYSNIQNIAALPLDGVKLDRSFAMADDGALMHRLLLSTIEMIHTAGHRITVEGVESEARLRELKATGHVQFAQGYHIGRPLDIDRFVKVLGEETAASRPRLVA